MAGETIRTHVVMPKDVLEAVDRLVQATLAAGAPDNVTVVVVEAYS